MKSALPFGNHVDLDNPREPHGHLHAAVRPLIYHSRKQQLSVQVSPHAHWQEAAPDQPRPDGSLQNHVHTRPSNLHSSGPEKQP